MKLFLESRKDFVSNILDPISNINESTILSVEKDKIISLTSSTDQTLVLFTETPIKSEEARNLNIPDVKKFTRVLDCIQTVSADLQINSNNIKYSSDNFKFTYHLLEDGVIKAPKINIKKVNDLLFDVSFDVSESKLSTLIKGASFATETNKLYIYIENNKIYGELGDKARSNTDNFQTILSETFEGTVFSKTLPINFDTFRLINFSKSDKILFSINTQHGVLKITLSKGNTKLIYIVSALIN